MCACTVLFFFECYGDHRDRHVLTHSFPTRHSSDLSCRSHTPAGHAPKISDASPSVSKPRPRFLRPSIWVLPRSEEHTSELQSLMRISYVVFCLKKNTDTPLITLNN